MVSLILKVLIGGKKMKKSNAGDDSALELLRKQIGVLEKIGDRMSIYGKVNEVYGTYMTDPFPAREVVCVKELPLGSKVEISMVAVK